MPLRRRLSTLAAALSSVVVAGLVLHVPPSGGAEGVGAPDVPSLAQPLGSLDPSFSPNPPTGVTDVFPSRQFVDVAVQQDGKIVAVSDVAGDFFIARFNPDGSPDLSFSITGTGSVSIDIGAAGQDDDALAVAIDPQNRIVVAGSGGAAASDFALVRLTPDGKAVQINTHVHAGNVGSAASAHDLAFQSDGTIVVVGSAQVAGDRDFAWVRFDGANGAVIGSPSTRSLTGGDDEARGVAVYPNGPHQDKLVMVGVTGTVGNAAMGVLQRNADGTNDLGFNAGAPQTIDPTAGSDSASGVAITPSGSVVVAGHNGTADQDLVVTQLLPTGGFDGAFNLGAVRTIAKAGNEFARNHPLAVQPDGRIVVVGDSAGGQDAGVFRLNADGTTDATFGTAGDATFNVNGNDDANAMTIDTQGRILVVGDEAASGGFVARLIGQPDTDGDGVYDGIDACPAVAGNLPNGCLPKPEAVLKGKKVVLDTVLAKKKASAKCPAKAKVTVKSKTKAGPLKVSKLLKTKTVATGCAVKGKVKLSAKPKKTAKTTVKITGSKLRTKRLVAVRL